jgi:hypothetical protein
VRAISFTQISPADVEVSEPLTGAELGISGCVTRGSPCSCAVLGLFEVKAKELLADAEMVAVM